MQMTPDDWDRAKELFEAALELDPSQRAPFLAENCHEVNLRQQVEKLLIDYQGAGSFLDNPAAEIQMEEVFPPSEEHLATAKSAEAEDPMIGRRLGAYKLVRRVGQGGMAAVFLARRADDEYQKEVAVKLVHPGLDSQEVLSRFRSERQTLAGLDHPNIVRLLDGGSAPGGLPFLVLEYVQGSPIDEYCDQHKLSVDERLHLFGAVCDAVQYAHEKLVIHRDLKPSNILVVADGTPKLLDFGIAKVLNPEPSIQGWLATQTGSRCMTPAYASPEQTRGQSVTPKTDVYSLGAVLYELLTGHRPYRLRQNSPAEIERAICEQEPEPPSTAISRVENDTSSDGKPVTKTPESVSLNRDGQPDKLRRRLRGDLDNIVLKALQKEPQQRYDSVAEFSRDIDRHLQHLPVKARPSTLAYRLSKFVQRHKTEVRAGFAVLVVIVAAASFAFNTAGLRARLGRDSSGTRIQSLAVIPLANTSGDPVQEYFSDWISETLTTDLAEIGSMKVISSTSSMQYKQTKKSLPEIAHELNVEGIVEGTVQRSGDRVRITAQLIQAATDKQLWAKSYERDVRDLFMLERDVAEDIARHVQERLSRADSVPLAQPRRLDAKALEAYLQGNYHLDRYGAGGGDKEKRVAAEYFQRVIDADPNFAPAYWGLAITHQFLLWPSKQDAEIVREAAERAVAVDPNFSDAHTVLGDLNFALRNWHRAEEEYRRAIALNPNNAWAHNGVAYFLDAMGRMDEGWRESQIAQGLDPSNDHLSDALARRGQDDQAIAIQQMMLRRNPNNGYERVLLFREYLRKGMYKEAARELEQVWILFGFPQIAAESRQARAVSGYRSALLKGWEHLWATHQAFLPVNLAEIYAALGDKDRAFYWLEQAYTHHDIAIASTDVGLEALNADFLLNPLRSDPRFKDLVRRIGLPEIPVGNSAVSSQQTGHKE
jgi:serine/threonine protein kinase/tetratricopeptide (TPR) repeat protein